jgi:hypothetical protein
MGSRSEECWERLASRSSTLYSIEWADGIDGLFDRVSCNLSPYFDITGDVEYR